MQNVVILIIYTTGKIWIIWKAQLKHSSSTFRFAENGLALTTNKYCGFNATLAYSATGENAIRNVGN